jgi:hypothetical protein
MTKRELARFIAVTCLGYGLLVLVLFLANFG